MAFSEPPCPTAEDSSLSVGMSTRQIGIVGLALAINLMDGFDMLAMAFTAPSVAAEWSISAQQLGTLFSIGLAGTMVGALCLSPIADIMGRRNGIATCLLFIAAGMMLAAMSGSILQLQVARVLTGIGVGAMISCTSAVVAENSSAGRRAFNIGLIAVCFPAGAVVGAASAYLLIEANGWRAVFTFGGFATALLLPLTIVLVPGRTNAPGDMSAPDSSGIFIERLRDIFYAGRLLVTLRIGLLFFFVMWSFYFAVNWVPKLMTTFGYSADFGVLAGLLINLAGIVGGIVTGAMVPRVGLERMLLGCLAAMTAGVFLLGFAGISAAAALVIAVANGLALYATMTCIYTLATSTYPVGIRATAIGLITALGRLGSVIGPGFAGLLFAQNLSGTLVCFILALPAAAALGLASSRLGA